MARKCLRVAEIRPYKTSDKKQPYALLFKLTEAEIEIYPRLIEDLKANFEKLLYILNERRETVLHFDSFEKLKANFAAFVTEGKSHAVMSQFIAINWTRPWDCEVNLGDDIINCEDLSPEEISKLKATLAKR